MTKEDYWQGIVRLKEQGLNYLRAMCKLAQFAPENLWITSSGPKTWEIQAADFLRHVKVAVNSFCENAHVAVKLTPEEIRRVYQSQSFVRDAMLKLKERLAGWTDDDVFWVEKQLADMEAANEIKNALTSS